MTWNATNAHLGRLAETYYNAATVPDASKFYLILCSPVSAFTATSTMVDVLTAEKTSSGYARSQYNPSTGAYDSGQSRYELPPTSCSFSATGSSYDFTAAVLLSNASANSSKSITAVDATANTLTCPAHGLAVNDKVLITADAGGALPGGISGTTIYFVKTVTTDTITLSTTQGGATLDITSTGTLPLRLRYANGEVELYESYGSAITIPASGTQVINVAINFGGSSADVNAA